MTGNLWSGKEFGAVRLGIATEGPGWRRLGQGSRICQVGKGEGSSAGPERKRVKQKDALMPGSDVGGKKDGGWRMKNGEEDRAGPHG